MIEFLISIFVVSIIVLIYRRYRSLFSLPFYWAAYFLFQYLGLLQIRSTHGGNSYAYAAGAFGVFFLGLLAVDFLVLFRRRTQPNRERGRGQDARESRSPDPQLHPESRMTRIRLMFPVLPLNVGLFVSLLAATFVTIVFFGEHGVPILASFPALAWVEATSGIVNRLMTVFGPACFASLGIVAWAVHRESGSPAAWVMTYVGLGLGMLGQALLASKAAAILIFLWFNIVLYYLNKKRDFRRSILPLIVIVIPMSAAIVAVRMMSTQGYWESGGLYQTYYERVTTVSAQPIDFIFKYMNRFGPMHGGALRREVRRMRDQLRGGHKTPIASEYVYDLMNDLSPNSTGLSAALTLYGTGYVEWGLVGMLLYSFIQGIAFGGVHRYLMRQESMNLMMLVVWAGVVGYLIAVSGTGTILVGVEGTLLNIIPPLVLILLFGAFFRLPLVHRYRVPVGGATHGTRSRSREKPAAELAERT